MLIIDGKIGTRRFENEVITPRELSEALKIDMALFSKNVIFKTTRDVVVKNNGMQLGNNPIAIPPFFMVSDTHAAIMIRYAKIRTGTEKEPKFEPERVRYNGGTFIIPAEDVDLAMFLYLHPRCKNSPYYNPAISPEEQFYYFDPAVEAEKNVKAAVERQLVVQQILSAHDPNSLRIRAMGMSAISRPESLGIVELQNTLFQLYESNPSAFMQKWNDPNVANVGAVKMAITDGHIVLNMNAGTNSVWSWSAAKGGAVICAVDKADDPLTRLLGNLSQADFISIYQIYVGEAATQKVNLGVNYSSASPALVAELSPRQLIDLAVAKDLLFFERSQKTANFDPVVGFEYSVAIGEEDFGKWRDVVSKELENKRNIQKLTTLKEYLAENT